MYINNKTYYIPLFEGFCRQNQVDGKEILASISGVPVVLKLATTIESISKGFTGQDEPKSNHGMLFVHPQDEVLTYWMKNVEFPLDIMFFNSDMELIKRRTMDGYKGEPDDELVRYSSESPCRFAVEMKKDWCKENNIITGCKLKF